MKHDEHDEAREEALPDNNAETQQPEAAANIPAELHDPSGQHEPTDDEQEAGDPLPTEQDLTSQGFTAEEVRRLIVISSRAATSAEARAAEEQMRRLRFTRWLIDHGVLDEWSA
jgi:hypothetical protein